MNHRSITRLFMCTAGGLLVATAGMAIMAAAGAELGQGALRTAQVQSSPSEGGAASVGCGAAGAGSCFEVHSTAACDNEDCCEAVCAVNERCCIPGNPNWGDDCVAIANGVCVSCGGPGAGSCFEVNRTPACNSEPCCEEVCAINPACCHSEERWGLNCVALARELCVGCGGPGTGDCFEANPASPYCTNASCCEAVCAANHPGCCFGEWSANCVGFAEDICASCGGSDAGSCFEVNPTPACNDADCCEAVCAFDSFCCNSKGEWDLTCVALADELCANCGDPLAESCCEANPTLSCDDEACCEAVCAIDQSCCGVEWDQGCADLAAADAVNCPQCLECGGPAAGDCCSANGTPACHSFLCCNAICAIRPQCCLFGWDQICADLAAADEENCQQCQGCGAPAAGDCCSGNGTAFCDDEDCCNAICTDSPQCCAVSWTEFCADQATADAINCPQCKSGLCGAPLAGDCCSANGTAFCDDAACCNAVCTNSPQCCALGWTQFCADQAAADPINCQQCKSDSCGAPAAGDCCSANGTAFCDDAACCDAVCTKSPQCCALSWTQFCADQAAADPINCQQCPPTCPFDLDGDGDVDLADFAAFLDCDLDLDLAEFAAFLKAFTGPG